MTAIFLTIIALGTLIFFVISQITPRFLTSNQLHHAANIAYVLQFIGLIGLIAYKVDFLSEAAFQITLAANLPYLLSAFAELLWPIAAIIAALLVTFCILPKVIDFFSDPKKAVPLFQAMSGKGAIQQQQNLPDDGDSNKFPADNNDITRFLDDNLTNTHTIIIKNYEGILEGIKPNWKQERQLLLFQAAHWEILAKFEYVYNFIFGTQIQALQALETNKDMDITSFYNLHCERLKNLEGVPREKPLWVAFLKDNELVEENSNKYSLSSRGVLFIKFLKDRKYSLDKVL